MRAPTTTLDGTLEAAVSQSGYLMAITVGANTIRLCSLDQDFDFDGFSWLAADFHVSGIAWDATGQQQGTVVMGDSDLVFWSYALNLELQDAAVALWACDAFAPGEAEPLWQGRIGAVGRGDQQVTCALVSPADVSLVPRRRAQMLVPAYLLAPPGTVIQVGAQQYILERQFDQGRVPPPKAPRGRPNVVRRTHRRHG